MTTYTFTVPVKLTVTVTARSEEDAMEQAVDDVHGLSVYLDAERYADDGNGTITMVDEAPLDLSLTNVDPHDES
jgi:hypothetical protein